MQKQSISQHRQFKIVGILLFVFFLSTSVQAQQCTVIKIISGDRLTVLCGEVKQQIRLYGVKTPRKGQPYRLAAKEYTKQSVLGKIVQINFIETDQYGRSMVIVNQGGFNLNEMLLRNGYGWFVSHHCQEHFCADFKEIDAEARRLQIGLWADEQPIAPWIYKVMPRLPPPAGSQAKKYRP